LVVFCGFAAFDRFAGADRFAVADRFDGFFAALRLLRPTCGLRVPFDRLLFVIFSPRLSLGDYLVDGFDPLSICLLRSEMLLIQFQSSSVRYNFSLCSQTQ